MQNRDLRRLRREGHQQVLNLATCGELPWDDQRYAQMREVFSSHALSSGLLSSIGQTFCKSFVSERERLGVAETIHVEFLDRAANFLVIPTATLSPFRQRLMRLQLLTGIRRGELPEYVPLNVSLNRGEICHWQERCWLLEERVVSRQYVGGSRGVSIRVAKGVTYRAGAHRGHLESTRGLVKTADGRLTITNQRVIYSGGAKAFTLSFNKVVGMDAQGSNRLLLTGSTGSPRLLELGRLCTSSATLA